MRTLPLLFCSALTLFVSQLHADEPAKPITNSKGEIGDLLRKWYAEGTAAGNTGDVYDNRDRDHSPLNLAPWPQMTAHKYTEDELKFRRDWAGANTVRPFVVFGNSSTSAPPEGGGSNIRMYYVNPRGMEFLYRQYRGNNLYMYPAHHDHHPGRNGRPFYGDLYPANTPYLIASQGSSGTDQPFMRALPYTLAAFRPEVKKKLVETGLLMPTIQMILRSTNKHLKSADEYLTGKAHPTVFEGIWVDALNMVKAAHEIQIDDIPPMVQLESIEEEPAVGGRDFFEAGLSEVLWDTPAAIARLFRAARPTRRMVVSAAASFDVNKRPLTFRWVVLRGDAERIKIHPLNAGGSVVELIVPWPERRTVGENLKLESNRIDIGAFVNNGKYWSAPGFVTFFGFDNEARAYDDAGRLAEVGYGFGEAVLTVTDWVGILDLLNADSDGWPARLLKAAFKPEELTAVGAVRDEYRAAAAAADAAKEKLKAAEAALKASDDANKAAKKAHDDKPGEELKAALARAAADRTAAEQARDTARKAADAAKKAADEVLAKKPAGWSRSVRDAVEQALNGLKRDTGFAQANLQEIRKILATDSGRAARFAAARKRLIDFGVLRDAPNDGLVSETSPLGDRLTPFAIGQWERFNAELLADAVFPKLVTASFRTNFVDQRLMTLKSWRDVFRYGPAGEPLGWTRYSPAGKQEFDSDGRLILEKDAAGRPVKVQAMRYALDPAPGPNQFRTLKAGPDSRILHLEYSGPQDLFGRVVRTEGGS